MGRVWIDLISFKAHRRRAISVLVAVLATSLGASATIAVGPALAAAPAAPANLAVDSAGETSLVVTWQEVEDGGFPPLTYEVSIDGLVDWAPADSTTQHTFSGLTASTTYTVLARATNANDEVGPIAMVAATTSPGAPTGLTATADDGSASLSWSPPAGGEVIAYYVVRYRPIGDATWTEGTAAASPTTILDLTNGTTYEFAVAAVNSAGPGAFSDTASATPQAAATAPATPAAPTATAGDASATVSWTAPDDGGSAITGYVLQYAVTGTAAWETHPDEGSGTSRSVTGLTNGTTYDFRVRAVNSVGTSEYSAVETATPVAAATRPDPPGAPSVTPGNASATVTWSAPDDGGSAITGYVLQYAPLGTEDWEVHPDQGTGTSRSVTGLDNGVAYNFRVAAVNAVGQGDFSGLTATTPLGSPDPATVTAGAVTDSSVEISWTEPANHNGATITGYRLTISPGSEEVRVGTAVFSHVFTGLDPGVSYTVSVAVMSDAGDSEARSVSAATTVRLAGVPSGIVAEADQLYGTTMTITWTPPTDLGGDTLVGYEVSVGGRTVEVGADQTSVRIEGVPAGTHTPTVTAINSAGRSEAGQGGRIEVRAFAPFASADGFLRQQYVDFLGRNPDSGGLAYWRSQLGGDKAKVGSVIQAFMESPEFSPRRAVARLYFAYFDRTPDIGGYDFWVERLAAGAADLEAVSQDFAASPEFNETYGSLSNAEFVVLVYNNVLQRRPDGNGYAFWLQQLNEGMARGRLMTLFSESAEYIEASRPAVDVVVTYRGMLNRRPDAGGFSYWVGRVTYSSESLASLIQNFFLSDEYARRITP